MSALPFAQVGLQVFGVDASTEMLNICRAKNFAVELKQFDLQDTPWSYADDSFDHCIACGVFHFIDDLESIFHKIARAIRPHGIFAFTTKVPPDESRAITTETTDGVTIFMHNREYIERHITKNGFELLKDLKFFVGNELFCAFVARSVV